MEFAEIFWRDYGRGFPVVLLGFLKGVLKKCGAFGW
jgi:hypothetical protein